MIGRSSAILVLLVIFLLPGCRREGATNIPDVSNIDVDIDITRFEQLLLSDTTMDAHELQQLMAQHPSFSEVYFTHVMPTPDDIEINPGDPEYRIKAIQSWIRHPRTQWLYDTVQQIFPDLTDLEEELESAFRFARYYFPDRETPRIYTTVSDFGYFPFIYAEDSLRDGIGISLEMFLGEDFPYLTYTGLNNAFSDYLTRSYNKEHITRRALEVWLDDMLGQAPGERLLDRMIHNGKRLYILKLLMPGAHDSVIIDYPSDKLEWVEANERGIWFHFTSQNFLYETSMNKIQKYIGPSPRSPGMPQEAPGNTGSWLGWQIVEAYMKKFPATTLRELIGLGDAQKLLDESEYRPPR